MMPFVEILEEIISTFQEDEKPYYEYGHPLEIVNTLAEKTGHNEFKYKKYPLIMLFQDFEEDGSKDYDYVIPNVTVVIATDTKPEWKAKERYENTFKAILYPIYENLITNMSNSNAISWDKEDKTKIDRLFWGKNGIYGNEGNVFNDYLDAIEIKFKNIKVLKKC